MLNPLEVLQRLAYPPHNAIRWEQFVIHLMVFGGAGLICLLLSMALLRWASLRLVESRSGRWLWAFRPAMGINPIRWREQFVLGIAPLPWLRIVPSWLAGLGVLVFSGYLAYTALPGILGHNVKNVLWEGRFLSFCNMLLYADQARVYPEINILGILLIFFATMVVGVRCGGCVAEEKRRRTWDDLVLTPWSVQEILQSKMWGILAAAVPYVMIYCVPMFALAILGGMAGLLQALAYLAVAGGAMYFAALVGILATGQQPWINAKPD
jgi:hypothetical protein